MPYTKEFDRIKGRYERMYPDKAKALTIAFKQAFKLNIKTYETRLKPYKIQVIDSLEL
jgi:hypothetical protein